LPFVIVGLVLLHIGLVHEQGSTSAVIFNIEAVGFVPFYPYFILKDLFFFLLFISAFSYFTFFEPNTLGHSDNYIKANPLSTPAHIVPEWYFLPFYAILRCIPSKLGGVVFMFGAIFILFFLPVLTQASSKNQFMGGAVHSDGFLFDFLFGFWVLSFILLGWVGAKPISRPYKVICPLAASVYFFFFFL